MTSPPNVHGTAAERKLSRLGTVLSYRAYYVLRRMVPRRRLLRALLQASWLADRFVLEQAWYALPPSEAREIMARESTRLVEQWTPAGARVIDLGGGRGLASLAASAQASQVVYVDSSEVSVQAASRLCQARANVSIVRGDLFEVLIRQGSFDVALLMHVLGYFPNPEEALRRVRRHARRLIVEVPDYGNNPFNALREREGLPSYSDAEYRFEFDAQRLRECCERAGWVVRTLEHRRGSLLAVADG